MKTLLSVAFMAILCTLSSKAQSVHFNLNTLKTHFENTKAMLAQKYTSHGFIEYRKADITMENKTEFPILIDLTEGHWYQFILIGDPEAFKIEAKLGLEGYGDIVTDKFKPSDTDEYWTQFSFICPRTGKYLVTFYQRGNKKNLLGHVAILQRPLKNNEGVLSFKN